MGVHGLEQRRDIDKKVLLRMVRASYDLVSMYLLAGSSASMPIAKKQLETTQWSCLCHLVLHGIAVGVVVCVWRVRVCMDVCVCQTGVFVLLSF